MAIAKKGLGRGLSALIPDDDMEFLSRVARGDAVLTTEATPPAAPVRKVETTPANGTSKPKQPPAAKAVVAKVSRETSSETALAPTNGSGASPSASLEASAAPALTRDHSPSSDTNSIASVAPPLIEWIETSAIEANPFQPRRTFSPVEMQELVDSVRSHGILQPILVRPLAGGAGRRFQLVAGERRWRAAGEAGLATVPAVIRVIADQQALELAVIENVQRHDISAVDAALAYKRLAQEFGLSQESIARRVGKSRSAVANTMRLLDLPAEAQKAIEVGELTEGHGRAILAAPTEGARRAIFRRILRDGLSVRETEAAARRATSSTAEPDPARPVEAAGASDVELQELESELQKALGTRLKLKAKGGAGKGGQIVIEYFSDTDLQRLLNLFRSARLGT